MKLYTEHMKKISDNRGSTIIVVLITMTLLVVLASVLLYLSLVNLQMKKIDRAGKTNFYDAEAVMNEVRVDIQSIVSDAINNAYTTVMSNYNGINGVGTQTKNEALTIEFQNAVYSNLLGTMVHSDETNADIYFLNASGTVYNLDYLTTKFSSLNQLGVSISGGSQAVETMMDSQGWTYSKLKNVKVIYTANGYETTVSADIRIDKPTLFARSTSGEQTDVPNFAIIAEQDLVHVSGGPITVTGSVYAGQVTVSGNGNNMNVQTATNFVSAGPVNIDFASFLLDDSSTLWAKGIMLNHSGKINIVGDAYISNDLNLLGDGTQAILSGRYYGYGNSTSDPSNSSSIIVNGKHTKLDMTLVQTLMLAGHSFVNFAQSEGNPSYVLMGQSISIKSDQLAYLLPSSSLKSGISNPYAYTGNPDNTWFQQNCLADPTQNVLFMRKTVGSTNLVYFCMKFVDANGDPDPIAANNCFKTYFTNNSADIEKYLSIYSDGIKMGEQVAPYLAGEGYTYNENNDGKLGSIINDSIIPDATLRAIGTSYDNLCDTLTRTDGSNSEDTPFEYYVDTGSNSALSLLSGMKSYPEDGPAKVLVINGNYTINSTTPETVHIIITSGDVEVDREFTGLIMAGGAVTLNYSVTADKTAVADAFQALSNDDDNDGVLEYYYLNPQHISPLNVSADYETDSTGWDLNKIVTYENWAKNET